MTEINNSHNIVGHLLMSWLTLMFSSFSVRHKNSKCAASTSDFDVFENLKSPCLIQSETFEGYYVRVLPVPLLETRTKK